MGEQLIEGPDQIPFTISGGILQILTGSWGLPSEEQIRPDLPDRIRSDRGPEVVRYQRVSA